MIHPDDIQFDEKGLVPAILQDAASKEVLTLAYMNREALELTLKTKEAWFYSRSRNQLWHKGETSGNVQEVVSVQADCDRDAILVKVLPAGPSCHQGTYSCFEEQPEDPDLSGRFQIINRLESVIAKKEAERPEGSYTAYLFDKGLDKILKKVGEEASEVIIAAKNRSAEELSNETADLLYHLFVLLREQKLPLDEVLRVLKDRNQ
ncbi:bifunctional phosphoribosyl-AMP cyclohydrolase/phosphoribosyl-ATP diphosphatase HisIE [Thermoactinomyces intermedius]|uniref:Histidine biosynthesis bifunctional protein HisIE n=1 Tax=Thermoactinomyces intermedius TaxID=2024 RepID=A0A8I1DEY5_THEIN|nr:MULTISPECIES: bifunctional phosphoribosyl-AMP cyclohydrolase/phosphoribosyl-ATP diphosphatase HisIE [Thermoactinomyces]MBA4548251.1 bifunctional phosphoribosyl-AMP cyclohydrolase/phosphoribosyl-ATP diphosphatase HisIE [Thermoactinomyces intermedius]MBA4835185.1 bifunctional phosphoribosyl-AMP cyclohydrolase/phosphoribosyl-ATP diphosphatase HisIE [Thermoactinomyces intermedius]MBH8595095.1 bifunctional phosphoribosyl-AMP cyclohydrolase/phosphoribosyl-ATP diphosphatase HisIE [Thermoactinomyces 